MSSQDRLLLETGKIIREDFLYQNAFNDEDSYSTLQKQFKMVEVIYHYYTRLLDALKNGASVRDILSLNIKTKLQDMRYIEEGKLNKFDDLLLQIDDEVRAILDYDKDREGDEGK